MAKIIITDPAKRIVIEDVNIGEPAANYVKVKTVRSYLSAGTELTQLQMGKVNKTADITKGRLGYSLSGIVTAIGDSVNNLKIGDRVVCIGQGAFHSTEVLVAKNLVTQLPDAVSFEEAAPTAMMCFGIESIRKAKLEFGENVLIVGAGLMGQIVAQLAVISGCGKVFLLDINEYRLKKAGEGIITVFGDEKGWKFIKKETEPFGIEAAFMCNGGEATDIFNNIKQVMCKSPDGITHGRVVAPGGVRITLELASASGNIQILSSAKAGPGYRDSAFEQGMDYPNYYVKWTVKRNVETILHAIVEKKLTIKPLITHEYLFEDALQAYQKLAEPDTDALAVLLKY
jgi:threonine dehydrogenase-like Zn-dependent dehydrogenase